MTAQVIGAPMEVAVNPREPLRRMSALFDSLTTLASVFR